MRLEESHIKDKKLVGHTSDDRPIIMVETHGGLFAFFTKSKGGSIETLAAAPHRAVGVFMCEQKEPGIRWNKQADEISKSEAEDVFRSVRERMLAPETSLSKNDDQYYLYYDWSEGRIEVLHADDVRGLAKSGELDQFGLLRKADFSGPLMMVREFE